MLKILMNILTASILAILLVCLFPPQTAEASQDWWDINYQFRSQITVSTGINSPYNGYAGYTVEMTMDTVSPDIQDDGDDLRIVWWDGSGWQELDRHIIAPDTASSIIRFRLQADIATSSSDDNYYIYYGNDSAGIGPVDLGNVYLHYDNFATDRSGEYYIGRLGITSWHGSGDYSPLYDAGNERINYDTGDNFAGEWVVADIDERDVYLEAQIRDSGRYPTNTTPGLLTRIQWATLGSSINDFYAASFAQGSYNEAGIGRNARNALTSAYDPTGTRYYSNNTISRFYFAVWGINTTRFKADFVSDPGQLQWKPGATPYVDSSSSEASDLEASGPVGFLVAQQIGWMDEFMVRRYIEPEPILSIAGEEAIPLTTVTTNDATNIEVDSTRLNGNLDDLGTATSVNVSFEWGQIPGGPYPNETTPQTMNATGAFSFDLLPLMSNTTYYFRAKGVGDSTSYGTEKSFTTLTPPTVTVPFVENDYDEPHYYFLYVNALDIKKQFRSNVNGRLLETADVTCFDGALNIHIPIGTVVKDKYSNRPNTLEIGVIEIPQISSDDMYLIGPAYVLLPEGTTFNPSIILTCSYDPYSLLEGTHEEDLFLATYDENAGEWTKLDCIVDTVNHTITAEFSHSMTFAAFYMESKTALLTINNLVESPSGNVAGISEPFTDKGVISAEANPPASMNPPAPKISDWLLIAGIAVAVAVIGAALYPFIAKRRKAHYESTKSVKT